jgi:GR25 family glycosyltransferase involved in LPS biosynthesis
MKSKIIRLKDIDLSKRLSKECIIAAKRFGLQIEEFDAINGLDFPNHFSKYNLKPAKKFKKFRAGVFGCFLSHFYLWMECFQNQEPYLILEHDGFFIKPLPTDVCDKFQDILKLDSENPFSKDYSRTIDEQKNNNIEITEIHFNEQVIEKAGYYSLGAYGYIIKPHAAKQLIDWIAENGFLPADQQIASNICKIETVRPTIVRLHPYYEVQNATIKAMSLTKNDHLLVAKEKNKK